jgi:ABC-type lipoprotein release transport system permease subunit
VGAAALVGALIVGDSTRESLRDLALLRLGKIDVALAGGDRLFQDDLASRFSRESGAEAAAALQVSGTAVNQDESRRANQIQVIGAREDFWKLGATPFEGWKTAPDTVFLNTALAERLGAKAGDTILLRIEKPSLLSREAPISPQQDYSVTARLRVAGIVPDSQFGRFGLRANQVSALSAFLPLEALQTKLGLEHRANLLLARLASGDATNAQAALAKVWRLADAEASVASVAGGGLELRSSRVFLDPPLVEAARQAAPDGAPLVTYFVNELADGAKTTPYSMVTAMGRPVVPDGMKPDEILLNQWLAEDLQAKPGDTTRLKYYAVGMAHRLEEKTAEFKVRGVIPIEGEAADRSLMPEFPGIAKAEKTENWDAGFPIQMNRIRPKDEKYWKDYRGTPKAFITLAAGTNLWSNRFGDLTAIRFPGKAGGAEGLEKRILAGTSPAALGLSFQPARSQALAASEGAQDFGQLFVGFSFFLIIAALLLMALIYRLGVEQRADEIGTLLAVGFRPKQARRLLLAEGAFVAVAGGTLGMAGGVAYAAAMLYGLKTVWRGAVGTSALSLHASGVSIVAGGVSSVVVGAIAIWMAARSAARQPARVLLNEGAAAESQSDAPGKRNYSLWTAVVSLTLAIGTTGWGATVKSSEAAGAFFGAGALFLIGGLAVAALLLKRLALARGGTRLTVAKLAIRACGRRRKRSLATIGLLACGSFLVAAVGANKLDSIKDSDKRFSGTGGFAFIGDTTFPVAQDLNDARGRDFYGIDAADMVGASVVPLRVRAGDDASCANLNRAQTPQVLGVPPEALASRGAFTFAAAPGAKPGENPWLMLRAPDKDGAIPAVADENTLEWALHIGVGDTFDYRDERGAVFKIRIVGSLANSILQGSLLIDEKRFLERFPSETGYRMFLIDAPSKESNRVEKTLTRAMQDAGLALTPAAYRLGAYNAVENTYLDTFQMLGGLGLLLGSAGLGVVVLRNALERRRELAALQAIGYGAGNLRWMMFSEHGALLALGLALGAVAALVAVLPAIASPGANVPYLSLSLTLLAILASGLVWARAACWLATRGPLMAALREN